MSKFLAALLLLCTTLQMSAASDCRGSLPFSLPKAKDIDHFYVNAKSRKESVVVKDEKKIEQLVTFLHKPKDGWSKEFVTFPNSDFGVALMMGKKELVTFWVADEWLRVSKTSANFPDKVRLRKLTKKELAELRTILGLPKD